MIGYVEFRLNKLRGLEPSKCKEELVKIYDELEE